MIPNGYYGPPWPQMYGMPQQPMSQNDIERGMHLAMKIAARTEREKERKKHLEKRERDNYRKEAQTTRQKLATTMYVYIIGVMSYPFVGPLYMMAKAAAATWGTQ